MTRATRFAASRGVLLGGVAARWPDRLRLISACVELERSGWRPPSNGDAEPPWRPLDDDVRAEIELWPPPSELPPTPPGAGMNKTAWVESCYRFAVSESLERAAMGRHPWLGRTDPEDSYLVGPVERQVRKWGLTVVVETAVAWMLQRAPGWVGPPPVTWVRPRGTDLLEVCTAPPPKSSLTFDANDRLTRSPAELHAELARWLAEGRGVEGDSQRRPDVPEERSDGKSWIDLLARRVVLGESYVLLAERRGENLYPQPVERKLRALAKRLGVALDRLP